MSRIRFSIFSFTAIALAALLIACSGGNAAPAPGDTPTPPPAATPTPPPPETPPPTDDCPLAVDVCELAQRIEAALDAGDFAALVALTQANEYECPPAGSPGAGGPLPICEGAQAGEKRSGYQIARRYSEGAIVDAQGLERMLSSFVASMDASAEDEFGGGALRLQALACREAAGGACELTTIVFTGIQREGNNLHREVLLFRIPGQPEDPARPFEGVWTGVTLPHEDAVLFQTGGRLDDLGRVYLID